MDWKIDFYKARWHLQIAKRMLDSHEEYGGKRFLIGVIREGAKAAGKIIRTFLIFEKTHGNLETFVKKIGPQHLNEVEIKNLTNILMLEKDQRRANVEFIRNNEILLEVDGEWKILKISRLKEFINSINDIINNFPTDIKR